jgi:mannose-6-phosphate isomerase-like protein (cupin superfamily)
MPRSILHVVLTALAAAPVVAAADAPVLWTSAQMKWTDVAEPAGARHAVLWSDAATGDRGTLVRWKFNTKNPPRSDAHDTHFVVLAGTFTLALDGMEEKQFGPGGFVAIPRGTRYTAGCEAAGECIFVMHAAGAAPATR